MVSGNLNIDTKKKYSAYFHFSGVHFDLDIGGMEKGGELNA